MKRGWQVACGVLLAIFALFAYESLQLSLRDTLGPGPGFFPFWLAAIGGGLAAALLVQLHRGHVGIEAAALTFERPAVRVMMAMFAGLIVATAVFEWLGFRLCMLFLLPYLLLILGTRNVLVIAIFAITGSFGVFHVFFDLLKVPLPVGIFGI